MSRAPKCFWKVFWANFDQMNCFFINACSVHNSYDQMNCSLVYFGVQSTWSVQNSHEQMSVQKIKKDSVYLWYNKPKQINKSKNINNYIYTCSFLHKLKKTEYVNNILSVLKNLSAWNHHPSLHSTRIWNIRYETSTF